jgi:dihydropteroate synthase
MHIHFITGRLAASALRRVVEPLAAERGFAATVQVLPITVAALMTPEWIARRVAVSPETERVIVPGYCHGDLAPIVEACGKPVERGPRDLRQLPAYFGAPPAQSEYGPYDIQIIAEINHCPRITLAEIVRQAQQLAADGANVIDVGCDPGGEWFGVGESVRALRDLGLRVSIDSLNPREIAAGVKAGAELVLSVNSSNCEQAADWGCEVVAIPDDPHTLAGFDETIDYLAANNVPQRLDPILEPIGFGFANSLGRYLDTRRRYPDAEMMMGIGNLTELTEVDSAGVNVLLLGFCQEQSIRSVLTTQVINWTRGSVRECDLGRRLVRYATHVGAPPKHVDSQLVALRDAKLTPVATADIAELARAVKDNNYRLFAAEGEVHLVSRGLHLHHADPFTLFAELARSGEAGGPPANLNPSHAFYLGYELCKALTANTLGKQYEQDEALDWGYLTQAEDRHYLSTGRPPKPVAESEAPA